MARAARESEHNLLPPAHLVGEIERQREDLSAERNRHLRTMADFKNSRRRVERDGIEAAEEGKRKMMPSLLDIIDDVQMAMQWTSDAEQPVVKGLRIIRQRFRALLKKEGVVPFDRVGKPFDPDFHEAVAMSKHERSEPGIVVEELRRGYLQNNKLLRVCASASCRMIHMFCESPRK